MAVRFNASPPRACLGEGDRQPPAGGGGATEPGRFTATAAALAGLAGALLGWRPGEFWAATPAELATALAPFRDPAPQPPDPTTIARLMQENPDG